MRNRELKFRVWNPEQNKMEYFELHNITVPERLLTQDKYSVQQFTGLKDKDGREIYEGDVVRMLDGTNYEVKFYLENNELNCSGYMFSSFGVEVIGNIFENPELLK